MQEPSLRIHGLSIWPVPTCQPPSTVVVRHPARAEMVVLVALVREVVGLEGSADLEAEEVLEALEDQEAQEGILLRRNSSTLVLRVVAPRQITMIRLPAITPRSSILNMLRIFLVIKVMDLEEWFGERKLRTILLVDVPKFEHY